MNYLGRSIAVVGVVSGMLVVGCGGSSSKAPPPASRTTQATVAASVPASSHARKGASSTLTTTAPHAPAGGESNAKAAPTDPVARLRLQSDAICERRNNELLRTVVSRFRDVGIARTASKRVRVEGQALDELGRLPVPSAIAAEWQQILYYHRQIVENLSAIALSARRNDNQELSRHLAANVTSHEKLLAVARSAGFTACARGE